MAREKQLAGKQSLVHSQKPTSTNRQTEKPKPSQASIANVIDPKTHDISLTPENIVHLQRTIGNQATQRMIAVSAARNGLIQRDLSFNGTNWKKAKTLKSPKAGVNPVYLIDNLVIKGLEAGGAQQQFASQVYGDVATTPNTRAVQVNSVEGQEILGMLVSKGEALDPAVQVLLVMEKLNLRSIGELGEELTDGQGGNDPAKADKLRNAKKELKDPRSFDNIIDKIFEGQFFKDLGKIHAVDMFLGNTDRMDRYGAVAIQNVFVNVTKGGDYGALGLDLDVEAASMSLVQSSSISKTGTTSAGNVKNYKAPAANDVKDWVAHAIKGADASRQVENVLDPTDAKTQKFRAMPAPGALESSDLTGLFNVGRIDGAIDAFKAHLENWFPKPPSGQAPASESQRRGDMIGTPFYTTTLWPRAKQNFAAGIQSGIQTVIAGMRPGGKYEALYNQSIANNPQEDVFDFAVLRIRARYLQIMSHPNNTLTEAQVMADLEQFGQLLVGNPNAVMPLPAILLAVPAPAVPPVRPTVGPRPLRPTTPAGGRRGSTSSGS